jgi:DNA-binding MarR family transcriptional regulator
MTKTHSGKLGRGSAKDGLVDALVQASFLTMAVLQRVGAEHDLSLTQLRVLGILRDRRVRMTALADYLGLEKSTMSGLVDRAEKRGLLVRVPNEEDGRVMEVTISAEGARLGKALYAQVQEALSPLTGQLDAAEQARLKELLLRMLSPG